MDTILEWLGAERYMKHAICLTQDPVLMTLYTAADLTIFLSYFVIGGTLLWRFMYSGAVFSAVPRSLQVLYGSFIFLCGLTHLTKTMTLFTGIYRLDILVVAATAAVSATTAVFVVAQTQETV